MAVLSNLSPPPPKEDAKDTAFPGYRVTPKFSHKEEVTTCVSQAGRQNETSRKATVISLEPTGSRVPLMWFEVWVHEPIAKKECLRPFRCKKVVLLKHKDRTHGQKELH